MHKMHQYLNTLPFDLYELALFHLVAKKGSFTHAATEAGLTQSAITRQIQSMEQSLGLPLFQRTTRKVKLTPAGEFLYQDSGRLIGDVERVLRNLRENFVDAPKQIRLGLSRTIGLAYLPGFLHANLRRSPAVTVQVSCQASHEILSGLESDALDIGILSASHSLPKTLRVTHQFEDAFTLIASSIKAEEALAIKSKGQLVLWLRKQEWLALDPSTETGGRLVTWMKKKQIQVSPMMELDNYDWLINLVSLGMGMSFVPIRALALYNQKKSIRRIPLPFRFSRDLTVVMRKNRSMPAHLSHFVSNILFRPKKMPAKQAAKRG
ncbi:MAG: LysR family transcriptional regulator [Verrucomicrobiales bacterium]|nr:LysR family transcriptional regulator [Verrucomicrobiales bacterium]